jgi:hypothetical protein
MEQSLFDQQKPEALSTERIFFITNQLNLREILTARYIGSLYGYDGKYYDDYLADCPGRIPLFTSPLSRTAGVRVCESNPGILRPVYLEIKAGALTGHVSFPAETKTPVCITTEKLISLSDVLSINFLTAEDMTETALREYSDLPDLRKLYRVLPDLFSDQDHTGEILAYLRSLPPVILPSDAEYKIYDRIAGAVTLCLYYINGKKDILNFFLSAGFKNAGKVKLPPALPDWFKLGLYPDYSKDLNSESVLFASAVKVLHTLTADTVNVKSEIIEQIRRETTLFNIPEETRKTLYSGLDLMHKYIRNEQPFGPNIPKPGFEVSRALLLFLMRSDYRDLLVWSKDETGANDNIMFTALAFAGLASGVKSMDISFRPDVQDQKIADMIVRELNSPASLKIKKTDLKTSKVTKAVTDPDQKLPVNENAVVSLIEKLKSAAVNTDRLTNFIATALCSYMSWDECVETSGSFNSENSITMLFEGKTVNFKLKGIAAVNYTINLPSFINLIDDCEKEVLIVFLKQFVL